MPRENVAQFNFSSGEVSPYIAGRVDTKVYANGLRTCENFIIRPQGGASRRLGSRHVKTSWTADKTSLLVPFVFSDVQAYVLQFGSHEQSIAITGANSAGTIRIATATAHNYVTGDSVTISEVTGGAASSTNGRWTITVIDTTHFDLVGSVWADSITDGEVIKQQGFINFLKDGEPLLETTNTELESFTLADSGGIFRITSGSSPSVEDLPGWGKLSAFYSIADNGTAVVSAGTSGRVRITFSVPHTLRTGVTVFAHETASVNGINALPFAINRINAYAVDLVGSTFVTAAGVTGAAIFTHGLLAGDRFFISGAGNYPTLSEQFHIVSAVVSHESWTVANLDFVSGSNPTGEEVHTIPIEVVTPYAAAELAELRFAQSADVLYIMHPDHPVMKLTRLDNDGDRLDWLLSEVVFADGPYLPLNDNAPNVDTVTPANGTRLSDVLLEVSAYSHTAIATITQPAKTITAVANDGGQYLITVPAHGWSAGQSVLIAGTGTTADGNRVVTAAVAANTFHIGVAFGSISSTGTAQLIFTDGTDDDGAHYLEYREGDQWRLALITSGGIASGTRTVAEVQIIDNVLLYLDEDVSVRNRPDLPSSGGRGFFANIGVLVNFARNARSVNIHAQLNPRNSISGASVAGSLTAEYANTFSKSDIGKFIRYFDGSTPPIPYWALINGVPGTTGTTANHAASVAMTSANDDGVFVITGEIRTATVKAYRGGPVYSLFSSTDVGRHLRLGWGGRWAWGVITGFTSASQVAVTLYNDVPRDPHNAKNLAGSSDGSQTSASTTTGRTYDWRLGAWSETTGYPSCACFHEQRLVFGRTDTQPATFWGSVTGDFENMSPTELDSTVLDDNALNYTLASGRANAIKWMESGTTLVIGTNGGEWVVGASAISQEAITPTNISVRQQSRNGSSRIAQPLRIGSAIVFTDRSETKVVEVTYLFLEDRIEDKELTTVSEHILRRGGTVLQTAFQQNPHTIGWFLLSDGTLAGLTYNADQEVVAWHRHELAGTGAFIESICVAPNATGTADDLYLLVKRTINGAPVRYIEVLEPEFYPSGSSRLGMQFVDCARVVSAFTGTVLTGLTYLTGETLTVLGNGTVITPVSFAAGVLTLAQAYAEVVIGLAYTSTLKSLPPEGGSAHGVSQGMKKRISEQKVRVADSFGMNAGWASDLVTRDFTALNESETTLPFFSGTVPLVPKIPYREDVPWTITYALPYPLNVLAVVSVLETNQ